MPETVHKLWLKGGKTRRDLGKILAQCGGDKAPESNVHDCQLHVYMSLCFAAGCFLRAGAPRVHPEKKELLQSCLRVLHGSNDEGRP